MCVCVLCGNESLHCAVIKVSYFVRLRRAAETARVKHADVLQSDMTRDGTGGEKREGGISQQCSCFTRSFSLPKI